LSAAGFHDSPDSVRCATRVDQPIREPLAARLEVSCNNPQPRPPRYAFCPLLCMTAPSSIPLDYDPADRAIVATRDRTLAIIAAIASFLFIVISATAKIATYRINPIFLIPLMWLPYIFRRRLSLHVLDYALFALAILFHDIGAYGFYRASPLPFSYDILVHYYFAIPVTMILYHALRGGQPHLRGWMIAVTSLLFMMGFGALHEIMEYATYLLLGEEKSMLKPSTSYFLDTQRDLLNNLLGTLTALLVVTISHVATRRYNHRHTEDAWEGHRSLN
jgi:uncharacterized membrane protein YjdF